MVDLNVNGFFCPALVIQASGACNYINVCNRCRVCVCVCMYVCASVGVCFVNYWAGIDLLCVHVFMGMRLS